MNTQADYVIFMGRFQPPHKAHIEIIETMLEMGRHAIVLVGSANRPRDIKNPWLWDEREEMIRSCFSESDNRRLHIAPIEDRLYSNNYWMRSVQRTVYHIINNIESEWGPLDDEPDLDIKLVGHHKDASSFYLDMFPQWDFVEMNSTEKLNATDIREIYFHPELYLEHVDKEKMPAPILHWIEQFEKTETFDYLVDEYQFLLNHKDAWKDAPYEPTFNTTDAVVFRSGHILLVKRRNAPGRGTWALPGGYVNPDETTLNGAVRELIEETKLKGPNKAVLKDKVIGSHTFDHPERSLRGRIFTHAVAIDLGPGKLLKVKGADDAEKAKWFTYVEIENMRDQLFEDHADIIDHFLSAKRS